MTMPGVQKPHCSAWLLRNASCIGCSVSPVATPSIVSTEWPSAWTASRVQALTASPSTWTTQAPHWLVSQPTWVPVRPSCSRSSCTSRVRPSTVAETGLPFTVRLTVFCIPHLPGSSIPAATGPPQPAGVSCRLSRGSRRYRSRRVLMPGEKIEDQYDDYRQAGDPYRRWKPGASGARRGGGRRDFGRALLVPGGGSGSCSFALGRLGRCHLRLRRSHRCGEAPEEIVRHLARHPVDQPRADLRELAADLGLHFIMQYRRPAILGEVDLGTALGEAGDPTAALAADLIALRRVEVRQCHLATKGGFHRSDRGDDLAVELGVGHLFERLAAGDRLLENFRIVECLPNALARRRDAKFAGHLHRLCPFLPAEVWASLKSIATAARGIRWPILRSCRLRGRADGVDRRAAASQPVRERGAAASRRRLCAGTLADAQRCRCRRCRAGGGAAGVSLFRHLSRGRRKKLAAPDCAAYLLQLAGTQSAGGCRPARP